MEHTIYDTATLLGVLRDVGDEPSTFWQNLAFPNTLTFDDEYVDFSKVSDVRKMAPLVVPTAQGKPIYSRAERLIRVKPAYVKPKDPITAAHMIRRKAGLNELLGNAPLAPNQRFNAIVGDISRQHRDAILRRWEWMAAEALLYGKVTLEDDSYPTTVIDFGRAAAHSITLAGGSQWGDAGVDPVDDLDGWVQTVVQASFGGPVNRVIMGTKAWGAFSKDARVKELMDTNYRQTSGTTLDLGVGSGENVEYKGNLSRNLQIWVYSDYYESEAGTAVDFMDPRDVLLIGPNVRGTRCFGAILDVGANFQPLPIFPKMWNQEDPSATFIMHQSAPLMVPVNPNNTLRARVVA